MKRIDITGFISDEITDKLDLCPSEIERIKDVLYANDITYVRSLCMKTETEMLSLPELDMDMETVSILKEYLQSVGLRFGMSYGELKYYQDADYLEKLARKKEPEGQEDGIIQDEPEADSSDEGYIRVKEEEWQELNDEKKKLEEKANRFGLFIPWSALFFIVLAIPPVVSCGYFIHRAFFYETTNSDKEKHLPEIGEERYTRLMDDYPLSPDSAYSEEGILEPSLAAPKVK